MIDSLAAMCDNINFSEQNVFDYSVNEYTNCLEELMSPFLKKATPKQARILKEENVSIAVKTINLGSTILVNSYINNTVCAITERFQYEQVCRKPPQIGNGQENV